MTAYWKRCRRHYGRLGLALLLFYAVTSLSQNLCYIACMRFAPALTHQCWFTSALAVLPTYLLGFPAFLLALPPAPERAQLPEKRRLGGRRFLVLLLCCFGFLMPGNLIGRGLDLLISRMTGIGSGDPLNALVTETPLWLLAPVTVLVAPVMEELCFRKLLLDRMRTIDKPTAMLYSALAFGLMHGNLQQFFYAFGVGLILAGIYLRTGRLWYCILVHMLVNFMGSVVVMLLYNGVNLSDPFSDLLPLLGLSIYCLFLAAVTIAGIVLLIRNRDFFRLRDETDRLGTHRWLPFLTPGFLAYGIAVVGVAAVSYLPL